MDLLSPYSSPIGGISRPHDVKVSTDSALLHVEQPPETPEKILERSNGRIYSYGPFEPVL